jgi:hypothetical protein
MPDPPNPDPEADQPVARVGKPFLPMGHSKTEAKAAGTILDTPDQLELFHLLQMKYALKIEINTGLRHSRGSVLNLINDTLLKNDFIERPLDRKVLALEALDRYIEMKTKTLTDDPA